MEKWIRDCKIVFTGDKTYLITSMHSGMILKRWRATVSKHSHLGNFQLSLRRVHAKLWSTVWIENDTADQLAIKECGAQPDF